jgi:hypothetical protein
MGNDRIDRLEQRVLQLEQEVNQLKKEKNSGKDHSSRLRKIHRPNSLLHLTDR